MRVIITNISLVLLTIIVTTTGCTSNFVPIQETPANIEKSPIPSPSCGVLPTNTAISITDKVVKACPKTISASSYTGQLTGSLIVAPTSADAPSYLLNMQDNSKKTIGRLLNVTVSPNRELLAYHNLESRTIRIVTTAGDQILEIDNRDERLTPRHWLDNQQLLLEYQRSDPGNPYVIPSIVILDVFTDDKQEWLPEYPNLDTFFSPLNWSVLSRFLPNATQTHVVYQAREEWIRIVLWDVNANHEVANLFNGSNESTPWWSNDGTRIVTNAPPIDEYQGVIHVNTNDGLPYVRGTDLFTISIDGEVNRLTHFSATQFALQSKYAWSPDDKRIAFFSQVVPSNENILNAISELSVVSIDTGVVVNLCLSGYGFVWSPDGKYIAINQGPNEQKNQNEAYIIDLENSVAWKIIENAEILGWVINRN